MDAHEIEQFLENLTVPERHQMFMILRRLHLRDCLRSRPHEAVEDEDEEQDPEV